MASCVSSLADTLRLIPGYDPFATAGKECWLDEEAAQKAIDFFPECLQHVEGSLANTPFHLELWQQAIVGNLFGWKKKDRRGRVVRRYRESLIYVPRKNGKALALDTQIPTPAGWTAMGDLRAGDVVFDDNGLPCNVLEAHDVMHGHDCYRVEFSDGTSIVADADHLWTTKTRKPENKTSTWTTRQILETLTVGSRSTHRERNHSIPVASPLSLTEVRLPVAPYVLGVWLGDGNSGDARFTFSSSDSEIVSHVEACGVSVLAPKGDRRSNAMKATITTTPPGVCRRGHHYNGKRCNACDRMVDYARRHGLPTPPHTLITIREELQSLGLINNKHIPGQYLRASYTQRLELLQGLMDTDGYVSKAGQCEYTTTSERLRDGFLELARTLGLKPSLKTARATCYGTDCGEKYRIQFYAAGQPVFRLKRKLARLPARPGTRSKTRQIVAVEPVPSVPVRCIRVDSPSHLFLAGEGMVPTHNTPLVAGICNYVLFCDQEAGAQIFSAAADREQAALLYRHAKGMVEREPELMSRAKIYGGAGHRSIVLKADEASSYKVLSADSDTKHGQNVHLAIVDELHAQPNRDLVDTLQTATASENRAQPLLIHITTADFDRDSICNEKHDYACKIRDGIIEDQAFLPVIYETLKEDDWTSPEVWAKANPNLHVSVSLEYLERECKHAQESPAYENTFKRLHLNMKTATDVQWLPMEKWDACGAITVDAGSLEGKTCDAGLDLATTTDIAALVLTFPEDGGYQVLPFFFVPEENAAKRAKRDRVPYLEWIKEGLIIPTPGDVIDYGYIRRKVNELGEVFKFRRIAVDRWNATQIATELQGDGFNVEFFGQGFASMSGPSKEFERLVIEGKLHHGGHKVLRWMASNCAAEMDAAGNIKPSKKKSTEKIDGVVATIMAVGMNLDAVDDGFDPEQLSFI